MNPRRRTGFAGVAAIAENAGTMASRSGSPSAVPIPRRNVRRGNDIFVMNTAITLTLPCGSSVLSRARPSHLERRARHHAGDQAGGEAIILAARVADDGTHGRRVVILQPSSQCVR